MLLVKTLVVEMGRRQLIVQKTKQLAVSHPVSSTVLQFKKNDLNVLYRYRLFRRRG